MIHTIIVEDERKSLDSLLYKVKENCPDLKVIDTPRSSIDAIKSIKKYKPDLILLDIQLDKMSGFDVLKEVKHVNFDVIFTTSHENYALEAFKVDAVDYLIKPIDEEELVKAIGKARKNIRLRVKPLTRIALPMTQGLRFTAIDEILYCKGNSNYSNIHLFNGKTILVTLTLREVENMLDMYRFFRIHKSSLINLDYIEEYSRSNGGTVTMTDRKKLRVARTRREAFLQVVSKGRAN